MDASSDWEIYKGSTGKVEIVMDRIVVTAHWNAPRCVSVLDNLSLGICEAEISVVLAVLFC